MEPFEYYISAKLVKKTSLNIQRIKSLINDSKERMQEINDINPSKKPKIVFENIYDSIRDLCDALLLSKGWKSYSHEASISYLLKQNFDIAIVKQLDNFRYMRNGSKYYGRKISAEEAKDINEFYLKIKFKLNNLLKDIK